MNFINRLAHAYVGNTVHHIPQSILVGDDIFVSDISYYQDKNDTPQKVNWEKMNSKVDGVIIRAGYGIVQDEDCVDFMAASHKVLPRGNYWYYSSWADPVQQANKFKDVINLVGIPEMELVADYEDKTGGPYGSWRHFAVFLEKLVSYFPQKEVAIYTGYYFWIDHSPNPITEVASLNWFKKFKLWLAWYTTDPTIVKIPRPWTQDDLLMWQYTDREDGLAHGVESLQIDRSKWIGTREEFDQRYYGVTTPPPPNSTLSLVSVNDALSGTKIQSWIKATVNVDGVNRDLFLDQRPTDPVPPPNPTPTYKPQGTLYKVHVAGWGQYHPGLTVPPGGGPLTQYMTRQRANGSIVKGDNIVVMSKAWEDYIKTFNSALAWSKIEAKDWGPSQGRNGQGFVKYLGLAYPGDDTLVNVVDVIGFNGDWALISSMDPSKIPPKDYSRTTTPWFYHEVFGSSPDGKRATSLSIKVTCPIYGGFEYAPGKWGWWIPKGILRIA